MMDGVMPNERAWPRAETTLLVALLALGVFLRAKGIASHPLWVDEYGTWWTIAGEGWSDLWHRVLTIQGQSPFYYALVRISVDALGPSPFALRLPSLLFGVGLLWACLPLAQAIFGDRRVALFAVAAFAVNERLIFYSQEARPYALALFCLALSFLAYLALLDRPRSRRARAAYLLATAATVYAHYLFGVAILIQVLHWLLRRPRRADLGPWLVTAALLAALLAPGAFQLADLAGRREALDWVERTGPGEVVRLWLRYFDGRVLLATTGAALLAAVAGRRLSLQGPRPRLALLGLWLFLPFLVIALIPPLRASPGSPSAPFSWPPRSCGFRPPRSRASTPSASTQRTGSGPSARSSSAIAPVSPSSMQPISSSSTPSSSAAPRRRAAASAPGPSPHTWHRRNETHCGPSPIARRRRRRPC
jgi:4-amino-4-deoxy-L-arabinose transferase-like glycosyltransferase